MLEKYHRLLPKPKMTDELKASREELPQDHVNNVAEANFTKCLTAYMAVAANGHC